jgi:hypothetical protein
MRLAYQTYQEVNKLINKELKRARVEILIPCSKYDFESVYMQLRNIINIFWLGHPSYMYLGNRLESNLWELEQMVKLKEIQYARTN